MRPRTLAVTATALLLAVCGLLGYCSAAPPDFHDFRVEAVRTAEAAHDALLTADLTGAAVRDGQATGPYAAVLLDDATKSLASSVSAFAELAPPDEAATAMRDDLLPMLAEAVARLGDAAHDPARTDGLAPLAERLATFADGHR